MHTRKGSQSSALCVFVCEGRVGVECWCFLNKAEVSPWDSTPISTFSSAEWKVPGPFSSENFCVWRRCCLTDHRTLTSIEKAQHQSLRALTREHRKDMNPWWCNIYGWFLKVEELNQKNEMINTVALGIVDFFLWSTLLTF